MCARGQDGLRCRLVRRAPLSHELLDVPVPGGDVRRALSRLTKRIRLGFGVVILPYHHPVRVAERVAMVDHLSGGRVEFGTGRSAAYEQIGMGIDPRQTRAMWEESLAMIPKIWEDGVFSWEGQFW